MHRFSRLFAIVMGVCLIIAVASPCWAEQVPVEKIDAALKGARGYVLSVQAADGSWDTPGNHFEKDGKTINHTWGGYTALATYSLLASGSTLQDPPIKKAVAWLEKCNMNGVYCIGLRMQVWLLLFQQAAQNDKESKAHYEDLANKDVKTLIDGLETTGPWAGIWNYTGKANRIDHSVSQYGVLGVWAAAQMGGEISPKTWKLLDNTWRAGQFPDGGWSYASSPADPAAGAQVTASMTAAGIASLFITQQYANPNAGLACEGDIANDNLDNGLAWMTKNFASVNGMYTFYGIERIGVASGYKYFGTVDWFPDIARRIIASQVADGSFGIGGFPGAEPLTNSAFGILFLSRGGAPVMMNKLDYGFTGGHGQHGANWNERARDAFNLARWTGVEAEADNLNWQIVNLSVSVDDLHDAPILYLSGNKALKLNAVDQDKLRQFVEEGGMILGNADCNSQIFARTFKELGTKLFSKYEFRELGRDHLIYSGETYKANKMRGHQPIFGLSNGVREMMLLFATGDPAKSWQQNSTLTQTSAFMIGSDIFQYATDITGMRKKGDTYIVHAGTNTPTKTIKVARLMVGNNPDPEPGGWRRLTAILHNPPYNLGVEVTDVVVDAKHHDVLAGNYQIVDITGTTKFKLDPDEEKILQDFVNKGGTLIIDSAGGGGVFADSAAEMLNKMFPKEAAKGLDRPLPLTNPIYNQPDAVITAVKYRRFAVKGMLESIKTPHIRGIEINGKLKIFFSREDLSAGLVGEQVDGINGYDPASATDLMRNLVLFAAK